jgi:hypothetical protein
MQILDIEWGPSSSFKYPRTYRFSTGSRWVEIWQSNCGTQYWIATSVPYGSYSSWQHIDLLTAQCVLNELLSELTELDNAHQVQKA